MNWRARHSTITAVLCLLIIAAATVTLVWEMTPGLLKNGRSRPAARSIAAARTIVDNEAPPGALLQFVAVLHTPAVWFPSPLILSDEIPPSDSHPISRPADSPLSRGPPAQA